MENAKRKANGLDLIEDRLQQAANTLVCDLQNVDVEEFDAVFDAIKDLAEAKCHCWQAKYYEKACEGMERGERMGYAPSRWNYAQDNEPYYEPMGYNPRRYQSGRYAPAGDGRRMGYTETRPYDRYMEARRHYTEGDHASKSDMERAAQEHIDETVSTVKEMWRDADQGMRDRMKSSLQKLVNELG